MNFIYFYRINLHLYDTLLKMRTRSQKEEKENSFTNVTEFSRSPSLSPQLASEEEKEKEVEEEKDIYEVVIDFDGASAAWRANKKSAGNGCYKYVCESITKTGKNCTKDCITGSTCCKIHFKNNCSIPKI